MSSPRIDRLVWSPANLNAYGKLLKTLQKGAIAFVGAGVSVEAGYPTWTQLLDILHGKISELGITIPPRELEQIGRMEDLLWRAEEYRRLLDKTAFNALMWDLFRPHHADPSQMAARTAEAIASIKFKHYVTTNYDPVLQTCCSRISNSLGTELEAIDWSETPKLQAFLRNINDSPARLLYLHGRFSQPDEIVLSERDYVRRYAAGDNASRKLFTLFATQRLVFLGFSLTDPDLMFILRSSNAAFDALEPQHFVVAPLDPDDDESVLRRKFTGKHGVEPVFFESTKVARYSGLPILLEQIASTMQTNSMPDINSMVEDLLDRRSSTQKPRKAATHQVDPDDPLKGSAKGIFSKDGLILSGQVTGTDDPDWFRVRLTVRSTKKSKMLGRYVDFHLHPTFSPSKERVKVQDGEAAWEGYAVGAFTVMAETEKKLKLELDLSGLRDAPKKFRLR